MTRPTLSPLIAARFQALADIAANPDLRRLQTSWGLFHIAEWAHTVALAVFAYEDGGATAVGIVGLVRLLPAALIAPFASILVDRYERRAVLFYLHLLRGLSLGLGALAISLAGPPSLAYAASAVAALGATAFRPTNCALLPTLARNPRELIAGNVALSLLEGLATFVGPALAGILIAVSGTSVVFAISAAASLLGMLSVIRIGRRHGGHRAGRLAAVTDELFAGVRLIAAQPSLRLMMTLFGAQLLVRGFLNVLIVVASIELLDSGDSGVGFLNSALGLGGLLGALAAVTLLDRRRLAPAVALGLFLWGAPIAGIGLVPEFAAALLALGIVGLGNSVLDVAGFTLLQRTTPDQLLGRVFGVLETMAMLFVAVGAALSPLLIELAGVRAALLTVGAILPLLTLVFRVPLYRVDDSATQPLEEMAFLRSIPIFAPLDSGTLQQLASRLERSNEPAGRDVIRQGDAGDRFYAVVSGTLSVVRDGEVTATLGPGDFFGEIALLRDLPRTATVRTATDSQLYSLERDTFVAAVSGHPESAETADAAVNARTLALRLPATPL